MRPFTKRGWIRVIIAGTVVASLVTLYLLRWTLFEERARKELAKVGSDLFDADVRIEELSGSLVTSVEAKMVVLDPREGSPFREFTIRDLEVGYGPFGASSLDVRLTGARFVLAGGGDSTKPLPETIREVVRGIASFRFPGTLRVKESVFVLPNGRTLEIEEGEITQGSWRLKLASMSFALTKESVVKFGPIRVELDPGKLTLREVGSGPEGLEVDGLWNDVEAHLDVRWGNEESDYLVFSGRVHPDFAASLEIRLRRFDAPIVKSLIAGLPAEGEVRVDVALGGPPEDPTIEGWLELLKLKVEGEQVDRVMVPLSAAEGALVLPRTTVNTPWGRMELEARFPFPWAKPGPPVVKVEVSNVDALLARLPEPVRPWIPKGRVRLSGTVVGAGWKVEALFEGDRYSFPAPVGELTEYVLEAELDAETLRIIRLDGMLGRGPVTASGRFDLWSKGAPFRLDLRGRDLLVVTDDLVRIRIDPQVQITGSADDPDLKIVGRVDVPLAIYYAEFGAATATRDQTRDPSSPLGLRLLPAEAGGFRIPGLPDLNRVILDLRVVTTGEFRIENSAIGALFQADLRLTGRASTPGVSGTVIAEKGQVRLTTGLFLRINEAKAILPADLDEARAGRLEDRPHLLAREPSVHFEGSVGRLDREILVVITGDLARPAVRLSSNPPRSQEELLALLAFGRAPGTVEGSDAVGTLATKVIDLTSDSWPDPDATDGFFERLSFRLAEETSPERPTPPWELPVRGGARGTTVRTEYLLSDLFSIVGETDRQSNVSGDLKLRIRFR